MLVKLSKIIYTGPVLKYLPYIKRFKVAEKDLIPNLKLSLPTYLLEPFLLIKEKTHKAYLVGGAVRDLILGKTPKDFDIVTDAKVTDLAPIFAQEGWDVKEAGMNFNVLHVNKDGRDFEIAQFRKDVHPEPGKTVVKPGDIHDDAHRRDLSINALYLDPWSGKVLDPTGHAINDLTKSKEIKFVGSADERINEDPIRVLRFLRFVHRLKDKGFVPDEASLRAARDNFHKMMALDHNRVRQELEKMVGVGIAEKKMKQHHDKEQSKTYWERTRPSGPDPTAIKVDSKGRPKDSIKENPMLILKFLKDVNDLKHHKDKVLDKKSLQAIRHGFPELLKLDTNTVMDAIEKIVGTHQMHKESSMKKYCGYCGESVQGEEQKQAAKKKTKPKAKSKPETKSKSKSKSKSKNSLKGMYDDIMKDFASTPVEALEYTNGQIRHCMRYSQHDPEAKELLGTYQELKKYIQEYKI
jgi:hypothetical protein